MNDVIWGAGSDRSVQKDHLFVPCIPDPGNIRMVHIAGVKTVKDEIWVMNLGQCKSPTVRILNVRILP